MSKLACLIFKDNQESVLPRKTKLFRVKVNFRQFNINRIELP